MLKQKCFLHEYVEPISNRLIVLFELNTMKNAICKLYLLFLLRLKELK